MMARGMSLPTSDTNNDGTFESPAGLYDSISLNSSDYVRTTKHGFQYTYEPCYGAQSRFRIKSMKDTNANEMTFHYDSTGTSGKLTRVDDTNGRSYTLGYDSTSRRLESLSDFGSPSRSIEYEYNSSGELTKVSDYYDGTFMRATTYTYTTAGTNPTISYLVATITDPKENAKQSPVPFCRNYYDGNGRVIAQEYGPDAAGQNPIDTHIPSLPLAIQPVEWEPHQNDLHRPGGDHDLL